MNGHRKTPAMRRAARRAWTAFVAAAMFSFAASSVLALDGDEILQKVDRNLEPESYEMYRKLINIEPDGRKKEFVLYSVKKGRDKRRRAVPRPAERQGTGHAAPGRQHVAIHPRRRQGRSASPACSR